MSDVLILGGTGWLSGRVAEEWLARGDAVVCLARGGRPAPNGARLVMGDRDDPNAYDAVSGREWDEVVDVSANVGHVEAAVKALADSARHWTYVSTVSVYAANDQPGADESAEVVAPATGEDEPDYGQAKAAAEASVWAAMGDRAAIVRPGLIAGTGDTTDRFGYWIARFARHDAGDVLVPEAHGRAVQVIDVDDLARFLVHGGSTGWVGTANAVGDSLSLEQFLGEARDIAAHTGALVTASDEFLTAHDVVHWSGPRSLPLWLPREMTGFAARSNAVYVRVDGRLAPMKETLTRVLIDERSRGLDRSRRAGLSRADELEILAHI